MTLHAGRLRHRIVLQQLVEQTDSEDEVIQDPNTGAIVSEWTHIATVWAAKEPLSAREFVESGAKQAEVLGRFVIRYRDGITAGMRIQHGDAVYNIIGVLPDKESGIEYLTLPYSAGVSTGQ